MNFIRGKETVTIERKTFAAVDEYGAETYTTTTTAIKNCLLAFNSTSDVGSLEQQAEQTDVTVYFPHGTIILDDDILIVRDSRWVKDGIGVAWETFQGSRIKPRVIVNIKQVKG